MNKELTIKVTINTEFEVLASPNLEHWNEANDEQRTIYAKEQVKEFLTEKLDIILDDLMKDSKITY